jgi:oxygen-independent coproporphyrinogen III oxidase
MTTTAQAFKSLYQKYNVAGPRYTSYPTVPYWETNPTESEWVHSLKVNLEASKKEGLGAALYLHIPFCESLCTYCGCNTRITRNHAVSTPYIETILKEWGLYFDKLGITGKMKVSEIHLGGGTPTFLGAAELDHLLAGIFARIESSDHHEFSIEVDPRVTHEDHFKVLQKWGFTRLSLGVQDFDPKVQEIVHRIQSVEQVRKVTELGRAYGFTSVNYDLIYGLPFQTLESIRTTFEAVKSLRPDRIAFYAYAHVPWIKASQRRFTEADLPVGDQKRALYELGRDLLEEVGYFEVGMDHFALETDSLWTAVKEGTLHRNFMGYTARQVSPLIALGVSSIGDSWTAFAQNEKLLETYVSRVEKGELPLQRGHLLTSEDEVFRTHILNLMTRLETKWTHGTETELELFRASLGRLAELEKDGLVVVKGDSCQVTELGRAFLRNICMCFDQRLLKKQPGQQIFSQTI